MSKRARRAERLARNLEEYINGHPFMDNVEYKSYVGLGDSVCVDMKFQDEFVGYPLSIKIYITQLYEKWDSTMSVNAVHSMDPVYAVELSNMAKMAKRIMNSGRLEQIERSEFS